MLALRHEAPIHHEATVIGRLPTTSDWDKGVSVEGICGSPPVTATIVVQLLPAEGVNGVAKIGLRVVTEVACGLEAVDGPTWTDKPEVISHGKDAVLPGGTDACDPGVAHKVTRCASAEAVDTESVGAFEDNQLPLPAQEAGNHVPIAHVNIDAPATCPHPILRVISNTVVEATRG